MEDERFSALSIMIKCYDILNVFVDKKLRKKCSAMTILMISWEPCIIF